MEQRILKLIEELKKEGRNLYGEKDKADATIPVWYVIAKLESIWIEDKLEKEKKQKQEVK